MEAYTISEGKYRRKLQSESEYVTSEALCLIVQSNQKSILTYEPEVTNRLLG